MKNQETFVVAFLNFLSNIVIVKTIGRSSTAIISLQDKKFMFQWGYNA